MVKKIEYDLVDDILKDGLKELTGITEQFIKLNPLYSRCFAWCLVSKY